MTEPASVRHRGGTIVEFETKLEWLYSSPAGVAIWRNKKSVDLRWVASATPHTYGDDYYVTEITMAGSSCGFTINIPYEDFMVLWMAAK